MSRRRSPADKVGQICIDPDSYVVVTDDRFNDLVRRQPRINETLQLPSFALSIADLTETELVQYQSPNLVSNGPLRGLYCPGAKYTVHINQIEARTAQLPLTVGIDDELPESQASSDTGEPKKYSIVTGRVVWTWDQDYARGIHQGWEEANWSE